MALTENEEAALKQLAGFASKLANLAGKESEILSSLGAEKISIPDLSPVADGQLADSALLPVRNGTEDMSLSMQVLKKFINAIPKNGQDKQVLIWDTETEGNLKWIDAGKIISGAPVGVITFAGYYDPQEYINEGWRFCNGDLLNDPVTYAKYFARIGNTFGGDGVNTAGLPNPRGLFMRAWNNLSTGWDANRAIFTGQSDAIREISGGCTRGGFYDSAQGWGAMQLDYEGTMHGAYGKNYGTSELKFYASKVVAVANEVRGANYAAPVIIKVL